MPHMRLGYRLACRANRRSCSVVAFAVVATLLPRGAVAHAAFVVAFVAAGAGAASINKTRASGGWRAAPGPSAEKDSKPTAAQRSRPKHMIVFCACV